MMTLGSATELEDMRGRHGSGRARTLSGKPWGPAVRVRKTKGGVQESKLQEGPRNLERRTELVDSLPTCRVPLRTLVTVWAWSIFAANSLNLKSTQEMSWSQVDEQCACRRIAAICLHLQA